MRTSDTDTETEEQKDITKIAFHPYWYWWWWGSWYLFVCVHFFFFSFLFSYKICWKTKKIEYEKRNKKIISFETLHDWPSETKLVVYLFPILDTLGTPGFIVLALVLYIVLTFTLQHMSYTACTARICAHEFIILRVFFYFFFSLLFLTIRYCFFYLFSFIFCSELRTIFFFKISFKILEIEKKPSNVCAYTVYFNTHRLPTTIGHCSTISNSHK